jgi:hypothetical protein
MRVRLPPFPCIGLKFGHPPAIQASSFAYSFAVFCYPAGFRQVVMSSTTVSHNRSTKLPFPKCPLQSSRSATPLQGPAPGKLPFKRGRLQHFRATFERGISLNKVWRRATVLWSWALSDLSSLVQPPRIPLRRCHRQGLDTTASPPYLRIVLETIALMCGDSRFLQSFASLRKHDSRLSRLCFLCCLSISLMQPTDRLLLLKS